MSVAERFPVGRSAERSLTVTEAMIDRFAALSGDTSRLHMDRDFAIARGFRGRVAHGALLAACISGLVGTELPGDAGVLQEVSLSFRSACCDGDRIVITATVKEVHVALATIFCDVVIRADDGRLIAKGTYRSGVGADA
jgi:3-hydroxybutyryl-CoA dehydratase